MAGSAAAQSKLFVTVIEQRSGKPVTDLKAADFTVLDDRHPRSVLSAEYTSVPIDVMLLLDTSLVGEMVRPVAADLVAQLQEKEEMAVVSFHSSADLIQDFTSARALLLRAIDGVKYGNSPRLLDALYAAADTGFRGSSFRRVILLLTTGVEGPSRVTEREVLRLARRNGISIFPVYVVGYGKSLFESLARQTGGAAFNLRDMQRERSGAPAEQIFQVLRNHYTLTVAGRLALGERVKVELKKERRLLVSALPVE